MDLVQRSYSGHTFRPRPQIEIEKNTNTLIVATSWGSPEQAQAVIEMIKEQLSVSHQPDATRVGNFIDGLSEESNRLRAAATIANDYLYSRENSREYQAAVEIALVTIHKRNISWLQLGTPHLLLAGSNGIEPLAYTPDWSWQHQQSSPLLSKALGMERSVYFNCGSHRLKGDEKMFFVSRSAVPSALYSLKSPNLKTCSEVLVEDNSEAPFWVGVLDL